VHGHIRPEMLHHPLRHGVEFLVGVVETGDKQGGNLKPDLGFMLEVFKRVEHRREVRAGELPVELLGEALQVHVGRIHILVELAPWGVAHVAGGHGHRLDAVFAAGLGDVDGVLHEDHRVVVGVGDAAAAEFLGRARDGCGTGRVHERVHLARLADVPVLAELAGEIAAGGAEGQHRRAGQEVIERLLFDRIHAIAARTAPGGEYDPVILVGTHETQPALAGVQFAVTRAHVALHAPVGERVPVFRRHDRFERFRVFRCHGLLMRPMRHGFNMDSAPRALLEIAAIWLHVKNIQR